MERDEKRLEYRFCCSSEENNGEEDNEGGIGAVDALVARERGAPGAEAEAEERFRVFDDFAM